MSADPRAALRTRLEAMRAELVETMVRDGFSAGAGAILAQLGAALDALDKTPESPAERGNADRLSTTEEGETANSAASPLPAIGARAVIQDEGGADVRLILFDGALRLGETALDPAGMIALAGDLLAAARRRLAR